MTKYSTKAEAVAAYMLFYPLSASSQISVGKVGGPRNATTLGDRAWHILINPITDHKASSTEDGDQIHGR